ncbi:coiled-coil domain-containing protein 22 homolog [Dermatophagoides farinae]|uniref:Coiled-coil domain-containing protein 22 homolog n=2 Tax=Dermatophagoides farinae TaxID=6954 RepID=A0A922HW24_DERFA|nr:coiled-coil domain-containing protein 22 homolog [Dermatophagoides farinae]KAH9506683.1 Coiled-coil domain-containing protein 22 [Dermatophagoides farinae]
MEEVDSILISQLREIGCDLDDENIHGIVSMDSYQIMKCVAICLRRIQINDDAVDSLIPDPSAINSTMNMSIKYKLANQLSTCIQNIGYKSDIGYQTFLYSNEHEIRRLLLYLVEQISTDSDEKSSSPDHPSATGWSIRPYDIIRRLKHSRPSTVWIPYSSDYIDDDDDESKYCPDSDYHDYYASITSPNSIYGMYNLNNYSLKSFLSSNSNSPLAEYCRINLNKGKMPIIPSTIIDILEWNNHFWKGNTADDDDDNNKNRQVDYMSHYFKTLCESKLTNAIVYHGGGEQSTNYVNSTIPSLMNVGGNVESNEQLSANPATDQIERKTNQQIILDKLRQELYECDSEIHQCKMNENELIRLEKEYQEKYKLFEASFRSKDELENSITTMKDSIEEIAIAWDEMQKDLLEKLRTKKLQNTAQNEAQIEKIRMINTMKKAIASKLKEIQAKESLVKELESRQPQQWPPSRGSYTRRIIEIIQNVKKQNDETLKVVSEMKAVQKDINNLNGKIERSFAIADETLFHEARQNEWNRNCYKSLALLQSSFTELLQAITEIGVHLREIRKLEEMIESENNRKTSANLTRINADLEQIRLENKQLRQKISDASS